MVDAPATKVWIGRSVFFGLCCLVLFFQLLPLNLEPQRFPRPDLLLTSTLVWVARRPDHAPFYIIGFVFLMSDLFLQRPPGLWAALVLVSTEVLRNRTARIRNMPLMLEWGTIAVGILILTVTYRMVLLVTLSPNVPLGMTLIHMFLTILAYPFVALAAHFFFGVTRPTPGAVDSLGHKL
jgi:rod shape-determining protein MreD